MAVVVMGWTVIVMRNARISWIVFTIITVMTVDGRRFSIRRLSIRLRFFSSFIIKVAWIMTTVVAGIVSVVASVDCIFTGLIVSS